MIVIDHWPFLICTLFTGLFMSEQHSNHQTQIFRKADIDALDKRYRVQLINSLTGFKSANLIGTIDQEQNTNLAIFSSAVHLGADPALIGMISRPDSVPKDTITNIRQTGYFSINHVNEAIHQAAHQCSARYAPNDSEFAATGLTEQYSDLHIAPYVAESEVKIGLKLADMIPIELNGTYMIIGEVIEIIAPEAAILEDGTLSPELANSIAVGGLNHYYRSELISSQAYAKAPKKD